VADIRLLVVTCSIVKQKSCMLAFFPEDQFDRDFIETEFLADGIHQVVLIRKVDAFGLGDKEDKGRWFNQAGCF